jgi:predicted nucleic acid-binding protein
MNIVVADAAPIIFLAKLDQLALLRAVFPGPTLLPEVVQQELEQDTIPPEEQHRLRAFIGTCRVEPVPRPLFPSRALSVADRSVLTLAAKQKQAVVLSDDALVRRIAQAEGLAVSGTLGILIRARRAGLLSHSKAVHYLNDLIARHRFRISVELYQEALRQLAST